MSAVVALTVALVAAALGGPHLVRRAAPALVRVPLLAATALTAGIVAWLAALLAVGPMLAGLLSGPAVLSGTAGEVCQRCLDVASPYDGVLRITPVPVVLLLVVPAAVAALLATTLGREIRRRRRASRRTSDELRRVTVPRTLHGYRVLTVPDAPPYAFTLPGRHGGIVVSTGALRALDDRELAAVLTHEHAHLRQHHHLVSLLATALAVHLRWIPLVRAVTDAVPTYLEIAADDVARRRVGTAALAGALLALGDPVHPVALTAAGAGALHATGPDRVRQLVARAEGRTGAAPALAIGVHLGVLGAVASAVHLLFAGAVLSGCA
ncbi:M56 family metallopeptidase [Isoptericola halotolerans]|uniref:M56 family metallopeptidase n=1 Tax=Isoptericola halotolerans TaxID=300560 RepID=UPI00388F35EA